ncbi:MAG: response regulator [Candidatus Omnitrophica bacterium]|nr:response regulator [Candidatus Omnitrophota bacterium]
MDKKKILLVDDEKDLVSAMVFQLEAAGYDVITAYDGLDGLEKSKKEKVDLIILDLMLPKMDGYKVCGLLKKDNRYSKIPIILFTARAQQSDKDMGKEAGADAYVTKPFDAKALILKIEELIKGKTV